MFELFTTAFRKHLARHFAKPMLAAAHILFQRFVAGNLREICMNRFTLVALSIILYMIYCGSKMSITSALNLSVLTLRTPVSMGLSLSAHSLFKAVKYASLSSTL